MYFIDLAWAFMWVFLAGGFYALFGQLYEWVDGRILDKTIGGWMGKQKYVAVRIIPPVENLRSMSEMENFFINLSSIYAGKSKKDIYVEGKYYENFTFEIHSKGGELAIYCWLNRNFLPLLRSSLLAHYPGTSVLEVEDPFASWPKEWTGGFQDYKYFYGTDIVFGKNSDLYPLKSWKFFQIGSLNPITDPFATLIAALEHVEEGDYAVFQLIIRPFIDGDKKKEWKKELEALKKELATNSVSEVGEGGTVKLLTEQEKLLLNTVNTKISSENFKFKIKVGFFSPKKGPVRNLGPIMSFFKQFSSDPQFLMPAGDTKTNRAAEGAIFGPTEDKWYWAREAIFREKKMYLSLIKRSLARGTSPKFIDVESLTALFHFPMTVNFDVGMVNRITSNVSSNESIASMGQPPSNLPT